MPAYLTIGKLSETGWPVEPGEIQGDETVVWHKGWMRISSFGIDMKKKVPEPKSRKRTGQSGGADQAGSSVKGKGQAKEKPEEQTLNVSKPTDSASCKIFEWAKTAEQQDIQIDCCTSEDEWPFLTLIFVGAVPTKVDFDEGLSDTLAFSWKKAIMFAYHFDEQNKPLPDHYAEFGQIEVSSATTTSEDRGLSQFVPPPPDPNEGAGRALAARALGSALDGALPPTAEEERIYEQERRRLAIEKIGELEFDLESFRGEERLSALFQFDLELRSLETKIDPADVVGHDVSFRVEDEPGRDESLRDARYLSGTIVTFLAGEMASDRRRRYHATVLPTAWRLTQRSDCRVFQDVTVKDVIETVFSGAGFSDYDMQGVTRTHPTMPYCVQYQESDFAFVCRLLEDAGIFFYFKHEEGQHTMMLCDGPAGYVRCAEDPLLFGLDVYREPRVTSWRTHYAFVPGKFDSRDYNFTTPAEPVKGQSTTSIDLPGIQDAEVFEYPGGYEDADQATTVADRRLQEREVGHHFVHGVSCYDSLAPGMTIAVDELPGEEPGGEASTVRHLITGIRHRAEQMPEYGLSVIGYRNTFTCIPEEVPYTPPRTTPKPRILGPQTAVVVGDQETDEEVVDTDEYGRVKVQFHWDRHGNKDTDSSCWIRVAQPTAGAGYGAVMLPRIGWEVVVSFLDGDPDRPLVTGVVYNELHKPHHELPGAKHKTVLMTRSFPGGAKENFNELSFHDEKDAEEIYFHAERDFKRVVEHDDVLEVGEKESGGQTITVEGDQSITIKTGNRELTLQQGDETVTLQSGSHTLEVSSGSSSVSAGQSIELKVGANSVTIDSQGITLKVGESSVKVENTGVTLKGMMIKGEATLQAELKGMMTKVSADAMLQTQGGITMMQ